MTSARLGSESTATVADFHIFVLVQCKLMEAIFNFADIDDAVGSLQEQINRAELMIFYSIPPRLCVNVGEISIFFTQFRPVHILNRAELMIFHTIPPD